MEKIQTTEASDQFKTHLGNTNNKRIIFSGSFGSGKTTFLNDFFKTEEQLEKYYVCKLFPVNYVTSDNKDIYELMKFDILIQLLGSGVTIEKGDFDKLSTVSKSIKKNSLKLLQGIMGAASLIDGRAAILNKAVDAIANIYAEYKDQNPKTKVDEFLTDLENQVGSSYEMNDISKLISDMLIKASNLEGEKKETILLIDDFDRLEPMQSFRLLNLLSTNDNETGTGENKFGFDKIIIVCDIDNLRDCFAHINGTSSAFNGYIDKFYSTQIFNFDIQNNLASAIYDWYNEVNIDKTIKKDFQDIFIKLFKEMISCGSLNIRSLTKMQDTVVKVQVRKISMYFNDEVDYMHLFFSVLQKMFVGDQEISNAIHFCYKQNILLKYRDYSRVINEALRIIYPEKKASEEIITIDNSQYKFNVRSYSYTPYWELLSVNEEPLTSNSRVPVFYLIEQAKKEYLII